ncbi:proteasome component M29 [Cladophialophora chaetospira]|uniref:Proteasome component M29 n=1 Tax=Cladophialophora chaetospira TaxID=386627 RepID=A0AA39CE53_9EURO|nr:proteasome component M29 [Cladophialophora chaetospira]
MASMQSPEEREYNLISKLELRIASASTDEKLQEILDKFLPALLLKLASPAERNRNLTIKISQYINQRLKINTSIKLPVAALVKTFRENGNAFVRRFCLIFIEQGLPRLEPTQARETLPGVLQFAIPKTENYDTTDRKMWAIAFDFLLEVLRKWKIPERGSKEEIALAETYSLSSTQTKLLVTRLCDFILYDPKDQSALQSPDDDFRPVLEKGYQRRSETIPSLAKFLLTSLFTDAQRLIPAVIMSVDANASASSMSDVMFKQCTFDLESEETVDTLFALYKHAKPKLQTKILSLLSRSQASTNRTTEIMNMVEAQLTSTSNTGLEASKLRAVLFSYLTWTVRVGGQHLAGGNVSTRIQDILKEYIEMQGWPTVTSEQSSPAEIELRSKAYESIGLLASLKKESTDNVRTMDLISWLFASLRCDTTRDIRSSVEESVGRIMNALPNSFLDDQSTTNRLKDLLLWNVLARPGQEDPIYFLPAVNSTTYPAIRFVNKCLPFYDVDARFINVLALASPDGRREITEETTRGLDPYWHASNRRLTTTSESTKLELPRLEALVKRFFDGQTANTKLFNSPAVLSAAATFCRNILVCHALRDTKLAPAESTDWKHSIDALVNNDQDARRQIQAYLQGLNSDDVLLPLLAASLNGVVKASAECLDISLEILSLAPNHFLSDVQEVGLDAASHVAGIAAFQLRAARIFGILGSLKHDREALSKVEVAKIGRWKTAIGEESVKIQGHLLRACFCLTRTALRMPQEVSAATLSELSQTVIKIIKSSSDRALRDTAYRCLRQLALCTPTSIEAEDETLLDRLISDGKKESEIAISTAGPVLGILYGKKSSDTQAQSLLDRLLGLHEVKRAEFHFALGESLAVACAGFRSSSTMTELDVDVELSDASANETSLATILDRVIEDSKTTKPSLKKAAAIWLLCLIQYCGDLPAIKTRLRDCQASFARLLNDRDDIVQETGSRGLSLVYERGDKNLRDDLVRDLVQSFTGSKAKMSGTVNEDTQLFEAGALPTENGQSVTTYKDIVSLATEMGDPSLVYRFMNLASNNAIWTSRAAFGKFGLGHVLADSTYLTENKKFYPKLFRYRFDPNPNVQRSMNEIWRALVKDSNAVINDNFDLIMDDLLQSVVSGKEWRSREASCAAISDLVQGREVEKFEKYLDDIWKVAFKVLDDVKETVRLAAMKLCRTLTSMLIRNLEVGEGNSKRSAAMLNHAMPFLLQQMDNAGAKEVQQYAIVTLLEVVKKAPPKSLRPYAPTILETLVLSLSSLEHEGINYLHLNADKYGLTAEKLDKMRVSSINASPVTEAIEDCLESITMKVDIDEDPNAMQGVETISPAKKNLTPMDDAMQRLAGAYRTAIGLPSKVGLSRVMTTLVVRHPATFRPYADKFIQLTRKHILDRNATISVAFSTALGYLMRLASEREIQATSKYAQKLYFESQELSHRSVAGEIVQAISKAANDVFMYSASVFLPFAFIGRRDTDEEVRERFDVPWKENIGGSRSINLYLKEIVGLILTHIGSPLWPIRHACCLAVAELISSMEVQEKYSDADAALIWPMMQSALDGKTWDGKEEIIKMYPKFAQQAQSLWSEAKTSQQMKKIAVREAKRTNFAYRPHAIEALGDFAISRKDLDFTAEVVPYLADLMDELTDQDAMDVDEAKGKIPQHRPTEQNAVEATVSAIVSCVFKVLSTHPNLEVLDQSTQIITKAQSVRFSALDMALYDGAKYFVVNGPWTKKGDVVVADETSDNKNPSSGADGALATVQRSSDSGDQRLAERFQPLVWAVFACPKEPWLQPERSRKSRADLALTLSERALQDPAALAAILDPWIAEERSRPLREDIERARQARKPQL